MKIKCPKCGSTETYLYNERFYGSIHTDTDKDCFDYDAMFCCEDCNFERKIYFWGKLNIENKPFQDTL